MPLLCFKRQIWNRKLFNHLIIMSIFTSLISGCSTTNLPSIATVPKVDLAKFMGDWYVIGVIPTFIETEAFNAVESYVLNQDGSIKTTFTFNKGSLNGPQKVYKPLGFVMNNSGNALWGMQFIWPFLAEYRIAYLNPDYTQTIIARNARDYVWIMARTPKISDGDYQKLVQFVKDLGYDTEKLRVVQHR